MSISHTILTNTHAQRESTSWPISDDAIANAAKMAEASVRDALTPPVPKIGRVPS